MVGASRSVPTRPSSTPLSPLHPLSRTPLLGDAQPRVEPKASHRQSTPRRHLGSELAALSCGGVGVGVRVWVSVGGCVRACTPPHPPAPAPTHPAAALIAPREPRSSRCPAPGWGGGEGGERGPAAPHTSQTSLITHTCRGGHSAGAANDRAMRQVVRQRGGTAQPQDQSAAPPMRSPVGRKGGALWLCVCMHAGGGRVGVQGGGAGCREQGVGQGGGAGWGGRVCVQAGGRARLTPPPSHAPHSPRATVQRAPGRPGRRERRRG